MMRSLATLAFALSLSACAASPNYVRSAPTASTPAQPTSTPRPPRIARDTDGIIGERASALTRRFGEARIDLAEGDAHKLQFASPTCVLDIFLYPLEAGSPPVATHVETRLREGGGAVDASACVAEVERSASG